MSEEILNRFRFHPATEVTGPLHDEVRQTFEIQAERVLRLTPTGRHQACALTALQEAMMWSNAAIANDSGNPGTQRNPQSGPRA